MVGATGREPVAITALLKTQLSTVYRHGVRFGKAGLAEVDVYSCPGDHLNGITGTAHGPDAADSFHNLGEIDLRGCGEPEAEISSPASLVGGASAADQRLAWRTAEVDAGPASVNRLSVMATRWPPAAAVSAATSPAGPPPKTTRS